MWSRYWPYGANRKCEAGLATPLGRFAKNCRFHPQEGHWPCGSNDGRQTGLGYSDRQFARELLIAVAASEVRATR